MKTASFTPLKDIESVSPEAGLQFSPSLYAWLKKNYKLTINKERPQVFITEDGMLYVGHIYDGDYLCSKLGMILCKGAKEVIGCYGPTGWKLVPDFWKKYVKLGRCHIDPKHKTYFKDERWDETPRRRTCKWCGLTQKKVTKRRVVVEQSWVAA